MRVIVTGGAGFIGRYVIERLQRDGHDAVSFDAKGRGDSVYVGDIRDATAVGDAFCNADGFVHLAGVLGTQEHVFNPAPSIETNLLGGLNILQAAAQHKVPGVCVGVGNHWMLNPYSITKSCFERFVAMFNADRGTSINIVRAMNAYGPRQAPAKPYGPSSVRKITPSFVCRALLNDPIELYNGGRQISDMVYVEDVAEAFVRSLYKVWAGEVFEKAVEIGPDEHTTVRQVAELVKELTGSRSEIVDLPPRPGEQASSVFADTSTLGMIDMRVDALVPLRVGMQRTIDYFRGYLVDYQRTH